MLHVENLSFFYPIIHFLERFVGVFRGCLKDNQSKNIVTLTNNSIGVGTWKEIVGDKLLPGFPAAGGQIEDGILHAIFPPKIIPKTMLGEIDGSISERAKNLCEILKTAKIPYKIEPDMNAFLITHSIMNMAMVGVLHDGSRVMDEKTVKTEATAHKVTLKLKSYLEALQKLNIAITPSMFKVLLYCPNVIVDLLVRVVLRTKMVKDIMLSDYASTATNEIVELQRDFLEMLQKTK